MILSGFFHFVRLISIVLFVCFQTYAQDTKTTAEPQSTDIFYLCKRDRNVRWLRSYKLENGKCNTLYSKEGYLQIVGSGTYFSSCEGILNGVKKNLEEGGFVCDLAATHSVLEL